MLQRGRRSAAALTVLPPVVGKLPGAREPQPPAYLGDRQTAYWWALVDRMGSDFFPLETHKMLATLCAVSVQLDDINIGLTEFDEGLPKTEKKLHRYKELTQLRRSVQGQLANLATKLRLTPQSRLDKMRAGRIARERPAQGSTGKPWDDN